MRSYIFLSFSVALLLNYATAAYTQTHTRNFATTHYHEFPTLNDKAKGGIGAGFAVFGSLFLFALVRIVIEEVERHSDITKKLAASRDKMSRELGMDLNEVDK